VSNHPETVHQDEETDTANEGDDNGSETDTANEGDGNDSETDTANEGEGEEVTSLAYFSSPKEKENDQIDRSTASETQSGIPAFHAWRNPEDGIYCAPSRQEESSDSESSGADDSTSTSEVGAEEESSSVDNQLDEEEDNDWISGENYPMCMSSVTLDGVVVTCTSIIEIVDYLLYKEDPYPYVLTGSLNQDDLEV